jgi:alpha-tubulin suppressor-like RCC1 family protein
LGSEIDTPRELSVGDKFVSTKLGKGFGIAVASKGQSYSWGQNTNGELGTGDFENQEETPSLIAHI